MKGRRERSRRGGGRDSGRGGGRGSGREVRRGMGGVGSEGVVGMVVVWGGVGGVGYGGGGGGEGGVVGGGGGVIVTGGGSVGGVGHSGRRVGGNSIIEIVIIFKIRRTVPISIIIIAGMSVSIGVVGGGRSEDSERGTGFIEGEAGRTRGRAGGVSRRGAIL